MARYPFTSCGMAVETLKEWQEADKNPASRSRLKDALIYWQRVRPAWITEYEIVRGKPVAKMGVNMLADLLTFLAWREAYRLPVSQYLQLERDFK